ncbi:MAG TPA: UDP-N-acetylglucosamine 2-epimerase (hydrolyzing), partial [Desulfurobacteriaceae bacterium]|nr:UDP-N-acetylglucosamine 2-epimerase (hydrolyzing) [Desulfurobacteriaceae bacterium]
MVIKKVAVITGTRADYGYLKPLIEKIYKDKELYLQLFVTGMHLVREHGYSLKEVERDFPITEVVDIGFEAKSTNLDMAIWTGKGIEKFSKIFKKYEPDIVFVLGDRIEAFSIAASAYLLNIPVAHIAGGELTFNTVDDDLRHAITKLSHLHFVSTETYKKRVLQLGEEEWRVYNVGALSLENIEKIQIVSKKEIYKKYNFESNYPLILILYHPLTKDKKFLFEFENIINALEEFSDKYNKLNVLAIYPNTDSGGYLIVESLKKLKRNKNLNLRIIP